ncbi:HAMP domain-containing histidine kinase [Cellulomonas sp. Sa3CUA2]|uniref:histidine kinase n=1 Tax=Cellulomonas avistercoris TaxID=2762242 RepID=A0ABR8QA08_9CELL|nr:HAMP domain-containing sensor histidine kinase [Cellulomonas avistercoris]MBD7917253.1 HAMP domain-containing histidine kinase [Cellulomonas avistercoris]
MTAAADATDGAGPVAAARTLWRRTSLHWRLVTITAVLLGTGLVVAGVTATTLLERNLLAPVDEKLATEAQSVAGEALGYLTSQRGHIGPTDYYVRVQTRAQEASVVSPATEQMYGMPRVADLTALDASAISGEPFTVPSTRTGSPWRVVAYPFQASDGTAGSVVVGLPLRDLHGTVVAMSWSLAASGLLIVVAGVVAGGWAVRRSLRPLAEIERTAAEIAAGDLSQRVPVAPASTEVGRLGAALNGMLAQIEEAFDARTASEARMRRFVADASHELRTPLAAIRGYAELYRMGATTTPEQIADTMQRIEGSAARMGSLVEDLLALARLDEGRRGSIGPVDLTVLAADAVSDLRALDPQRPVRLVALDGVTAPRVVVGDEERLRQVLANLVGNAARHTPPATPVEIAVGAADDETAVVEVRDHGPGIPPEHAERVFERFYRIDASRTRDSGGSGLGMAIVAAIVASHGGTVAVHPTPGGGATVRVELPVAGPPPASRPADATPAADVATMTGPSPTS